MLPTPDEGLESLGAFIRAARVARGINQLRLAREARVSRKQLALLEQGGNVSVKFLLRVARFLDLSTIPLDGSVQLASGQSGLNVFGMLQALDFLAAFIEYLRNSTMDAVMPPSERRHLTDTPAFRDFVASLLDESNPAAAEKLAKAMTQVGDDLQGGSAPPRHTEETAALAVPASTRKRRA